MPSAFSSSFPLLEESFMKSCYYLADAMIRKTYRMFEVVEDV